VLLVTEPSKAREIARQAMAFYLRPSNYRNNWKRLGFTDEDLDDDGTNRFLDAMVAWGTETPVNQRIQAHFEAGASHVCIQPLHSQGQPIPDYNALTALAHSFADGTAVPAKARNGASRPVPATDAGGRLSVSKAVLGCRRLGRANVWVRI